MMKDFDFTNPMQVPRVEKIVVNVGVGEAIDNAKALDSALEDTQTITGQRPIITKARKSIANFKLREGRSIGLKVTLRGERMWSFFDRLINVALPRTRDFRGVSPNSVTIPSGSPPSEAPGVVASNTQTSARPIPGVVSSPGLSGSV